MSAAAGGSSTLPTREEQARWKPLEWERFKDERRRYWARIKPQMLRKSCTGRGLWDGGEAAALRDRLLKSDLGLGLTDTDMHGPGDDGAAASAADSEAAPQTGEAPEQPAYQAQPGERCYSVNCQNACDPSKECPNCKKNGMRTFFCSNVSPSQHPLIVLPAEGLPTDRACVRCSGVLQRLLGVP